MYCCEKRLVYIEKNSCFHLVQGSQKSLCPKNITFHLSHNDNDNILKPTWNRKLSYVMWSKYTDIP